MLEIFVYNKAFGEPTASPFCVKALAMAKMSGQPFKAVYLNDPRKSPTQKLPFMKDGTQVIADSGFIRTYLENTYGVDFDDGLSDEQRAQSHAIIRMAEEHLYFLVGADRWLNDNNWVHVREALFGKIPRILKGFITNKIRKEAERNFYGQGIGRFTEEQRFQRAKQDIDAIAALLRDKPYLFGERYHSADISVATMLRGCAASPTETKLSSYVKDNPTLTAYMERCVETFYP